MKNGFVIRTLAAALCASLALACAGCTKESGTNNPDGTANPSQSVADDAVQNTAVTDNSITAEAVTGDFSMTTEDGVFTQSGSVYEITAAGTYAVKGALDGQILVKADDSDIVVIEMSGAAISSSTDSPIRIVSADKVEISAKKDTDNVVSDNRSAKTFDNGEVGEGAIYAKADLKIKGTGTLVVTGSYNNGIHTTKDLTIQKLSLKVTANNIALKGNDSVTVESGNVVAVSQNGDGVKTTETDANKSGKTRGDIALYGCGMAVYAAGDGFSAAHDFIMAADDEGNMPSVSVYTGAYSGYTADTANTDSYKGVKSNNEITISAGDISISSYDDGLHANYGKAMEAGGVGLGNINITGGSITMAVYSPEGKTGGGKMGPGGHGGWGGQKTVSGADSIHADGILSISGGTVNIDSSYEGLEANVVNISGGETVICAVDDGVNACKGQSTPAVNITGGLLDVAVSPDGDVDGIDSNGTYTQTGGVVITRGPNSQMAAAIDAEGSVSVTGGTLIMLGYGNVQTGGNVKSYSLSLHSQGTHTVSIGGNSYTFNNSSAYAQTLCVSDAEVTAQ